MATRTVANGGGNFNSTGTWVEGAVPTSADDVVFTSTSGQLTVNVASSCKSINFTNFTNTFTLNSTLSVYGNITLASGFTQAGNWGIIVSANATITSNGVIWTRQLSTSGNITLTLADNWTVRNIFVVNGTTANNFTTVNGNTMFVNTLSTNVQSISGTTNFIMDGTGSNTLGGSGIYRINLTFNTTGTITIGNNSRYDGSTITYIAGTIVAPLISISGAGTTTTFNTSGMTWNSITFGAIQNIVLNSNLNFSGTTTIAAVVTFSGSGKLTPTPPSSLTITPTVTYDTTLFPSTIQLTNLTLGNNGTTTTINGVTFYVSGNFTPANTSNGVAAGTSTVIMNGTGTINMQNNGRTTMPVVINTSGTITFANQVQFLNSLTYTAGTTITTGSTLTINTAGTYTYNTAGIIWDNVSITANTTITNNSLLTATGQSTFGQAAIGWTGSNGFRLSKLDITATNSSAIYTLKPGLTYTVVDQFTANTNVSGEQHPIFKSGTPGTKANLKFDKYSGTCYLGYIDFTDIDASGGRTITTFSGSLSNTTNIKSFTDSQVVGF